MQRKRNAPAWASGKLEDKVTRPAEACSMKEPLPGRTFGESVPTKKSDYPLF
jgi:hypothetical protein